MKFSSFLFTLTCCLILGCQSPTPDSEKIHQFMDAWHEAAANADETTFFGSMTADAIYLGTDASERWKRDELRKWSERFFERESAWNFTPVRREVYFSEDGQYAWFEELLETWMGQCRGSGVLHKGKDGWKIKHYNLAVTIHNDLIKEFIVLVKQDPANGFLEE